MECDLVAMNLATRSDIGVIQTTRTVISGLRFSMNTRVPIIVITPVKSWVKPIRRPSANVSASAIILLKISPVLWESR